MNQRRDRFDTFLERARAGALSTAVYPADAPTAEFLAPTDGEPGAGAFTVHYADADLALVSHATDGVRRCGVVGVDPFRSGGIAGVPVDGGDGSLAGVTRAAILSVLGIDSWLPITTATERTLPYGQCHRLQGWAAVKRITFTELERGWEPGPEHATDPIVRDEFSAKTVETGNQTVHVAAGGELNTCDAADRRTDPTVTSVVKCSGETDIWIEGDQYDRRRLTLPQGVYCFFSIANPSRTSQDDTTNRRPAD